MKKFIRLFFVVVIVSLLQGCNTMEKKVEKVPKKALPKVEAQRFPLEKKWHARQGNGVSRSYAVLSPSKRGSQIYFADSKGSVFSYTSDGKKEWESKVSIKVSSAVASSNYGLLLLGETKAVLLDSNDGKLIWESDLGSEAYALPTISKSHAYVHLLDGFIVALDLNTGRVAWRYSAQTPSIVFRKSSAPVVDSGKLFTGLANGKVVALREHDGSLYWEQEVGVAVGKRDTQRMADVSATPTIDSNAVYAGAYQGNLSALDIVTGKVIWQTPISTLSGGDIHKDSLFYTDTKGHLNSYSKSSGRLNWGSDLLEGRTLTAPVVFNGNVYVGDEEGHLHVFGFNGEYLSRVKLSSTLTKAPIVSNGELIVLTSNGTLYVFKG